MTVSMGIDPGVEGYICKVFRIDDCEEIKLWPMPVRDGDRAGEGADLDDARFTEILCEEGPKLDILVVEAQQGFPGAGPRCPACHKPRNMQGVASTFKTGMNFGIIKGLARALGLPLVVVQPQEWKPVWGLTADKALSVAKAQILAPHFDWRDRENKSRARVPNHNACESYILAKHGLRLLKGAAK